MFRTFKPRSTDTISSLHDQGLHSTFQEAFRLVMHFKQSVRSHLLAGYSKLSIFQPLPRLPRYHVYALARLEPTLVCSIEDTT